jgi:PadR family transcriptional regulator PadR
MEGWSRTCVTTGGTFFEVVLSGPGRDFFRTLCRLATMASNGPRLTAQTLKVLGVLMSPAQDEISGAEIARMTDLASGTLYPMLLRLEQAGWLESRWEDGDPSKLRRPRRRLYRITGVGFRRAKSEFRELMRPLKEFAWL